MEKSTNQPLEIKITVSNLSELRAYQKGILAILSRIEILTYDPILNKDLIAVYELLSQLQANEEFVTQRQALLLNSKNT